MLVTEFTEMTGYTPTVEEYREIESMYYDFDGNKQEFCALWSKLHPSKAGQVWRAKKEAEAREKEVEKVLTIVRRYVFNKKASSVALSKEDFKEMFKNCDRLTVRETIFNLKDWRGVTQNWCGDAVWRNYWNLHSACAYGW